MAATSRRSSEATFEWSGRGGVAKKFLDQTTPSSAQLRREFCARVGARLALPVAEVPQQAMTRNGFTLIEALITTVILVTGLTALAGAFSYSSLHTLRIQQQTAALALLSSKLEELKVAAQLTPGRHSEYLQIAADGAIVAGGPGSGYKRTWEITAEMPSRITVIILGKARGRGQLYFELARATTKAGSRF